MTLLPIVARELRVAARKRSTFWLRVIAALVAIVIGAGFMAVSAAGGMGTARLGGNLFVTLAWLALAASLSAGLFFTSDALSEEKREGTIGFLFLTDLRGYDIAGGKLAATSLRGSYALLAFFPILAITLLMGGVTGSQFWKTNLALLNALFCSLAAGLCVSSVSKDAQKAMSGTLLVLFLLTAAGPFAGAAFSAAGHPGASKVLSLSSPYQVFRMAGTGARSYFWEGLLASHAIGWAMLGLAALFVPRTWQERNRRFSNVAWRRGWKYGRPRFRTAFRRKMLDRNPVLWLVSRERWQASGMWALALLSASGLGLAVATSLPLFGMIWNRVNWLFFLVLYLWTASQASRFFVEGRRNGLLELLLVAPVTSKEIVQGQWRGLLRMTALPVLVLLVVHGVGTCLAQRASMGAATRGFGVPTPVLASVLLGVFVAVSTCANLVAQSWFGMWMGLTSRKPGLATLKTVLFVHVVPWLVITFASALISILVIVPMFMNSGAFSGTVSPTTVVSNGSGTTTTVVSSSRTTTVFTFSSGVTTTSNSVAGATNKLGVSSSPTGAIGPASGWFSLFPVVMSGVAVLLTIGKDVAFLLWARRKLYSSFREQAVRSISPFPVWPLAPLPPPLPGLPLADGPA